MKDYEIFDAHCDTLCCLCDKGGTLETNTYNIDKTRMSDYRDYTQVFACFISPEYYNDPMSRFNALYDTYKKQNFAGITPILSLEGGEPISSLEDIDYLNECGVRCIALTWNNTNRLGGGVLDGDCGLTQFGRSAVRKMEDLGILVDVSHLSDKAFYDVAAIARNPIIATHSNSRSICPHPRNVTDDMFKIIRDSGGVVGLNLYPLFLTENNSCTSHDAIMHMEHFLSLDGENAVGFGADFDGTDNLLPDDVRGCEGLYRIADLIKDRETAEKITHRNFMRLFGGGTENA